MDLTIKRKYNPTMLTHSILNNNPLIAPCIFNGGVPNGLPNTNQINSQANMNNNTNNNLNSSTQTTSTNLPAGIANIPTTGTSVNDFLNQEDLIRHLQEKYKEQLYIQELFRQHRFDDYQSFVLHSQFGYNYPPYNYPHPQFTNLRPQTTTSTLQQSSSSSTTTSPPLAQSSAKSTTRSPSLSPSSSPVDDKEKLKNDDKINDNNEEPPFPRYNSIETISKKLNNIAKINSVEPEFSKTNDENHNIMKSSRSPTSTGTLINDKNLPHSNTTKLNPHLILQQSPLFGNLASNNKLALSTGLLNSKEGNKLINNHRTDNNINNEITSSTLTITPGMSNSSLTNSNNGSNTNNSNNSTSNNNSIFVPPCTSNGISLELREKLRQKIHKRQDKNNLSPATSIGNLNSSNNNLSNIGSSSSNNSSSNNNSNSKNNNSINNYLLSYSMYDDSGLRRTSSEPNFKVRSALKERIKKRIDPLLNNKRNPQSSNATSPPAAAIHNVKNNDEIPASLLAAAPGLRLSKESEANNSAFTALANTIIQQPNTLNQQYPFDALFSQNHLQSLLLNAASTQSQPYLNNIQYQALAAIANALPTHASNPLKDHLTSLSMSALPNPNSNQIHAKRQRTAQMTTPTATSTSAGTSSSSSNARASFIPQFGNIAHVEEESEMLLANELKDASKVDEEMQNAFIYGNDDDEDEDEEDDEIDTRPRGFHSYNAAIHRHPRHFFKKISCYSDPYLMRSNLLNQQIHNEELTTSNESITQPRGSNSRLNDRRNTLSAENAMEFATNERTSYKYTTGLVYDSRMLEHECTCHNSKNHIETPARLQAIWNRFEMKGVVDECEVIKAKMASIEDITICHSKLYASIYGADIELRSKLKPEYLQEYLMSICMAPCNGLALVCDQDNSWNEEHTPIACRVAIGSTYELAELVTLGKLKNGFALVRPPGSHAEHNKPLGFCYFNNVAIAAKLLKKNLNLERILIVDWDVHHGNGTQQLTYDDPNILYISLHRHDNGKFFPGSGSIDECGTEDGLGYNVNIAWSGKLEPPMGDSEYLAAFRCVVMPIAKAFKPQLVLVSCGFDGTESHPKELGGYKLTPMLFAYMTKKLMSLAEGKVVLVLEGGYDLSSLCDCSEMCVNALMNKQIPSFPNETLDAIPNNPAIQTLERVIDVQKRYWPTLKDNSKYIKMSQNQFIRIDTAE